MMINRSRQWWLERIADEPAVFIGAGIGGCDMPDTPFVHAVRQLCFMARTSGGTAGRDEGLCASLDAVEAFLVKPST